MPAVKPAMPPPIINTSNSWSGTGNTSLSGDQVDFMEKRPVIVPSVVLRVGIWNLGRLGHGLQHGSDLECRWNLRGV